MRLFLRYYITDNNIEIMISSEKHVQKYLNEFISRMLYNRHYIEIMSSSDQHEQQYLNKNISIMFYDR